MRKIILWLFRINLLVLLLMANHAWPFWFMDGLEWHTPVREGYAAITIAISILYYYKCVNGKLTFSTRAITIAILLLLCFLYMYRGLWSIMVFFQSFPIIVLCDDKKNATGHLNFIAIALSVVVLPGIVLHLYHLTIGLPPSLPVMHPFSDTYFYYFYIFDLINISWLSGGFPRFNSIFLEPAHLAILIVWMVYARRFELKDWPNRILLVGLLLTFSLLGYISLLVMYIYSTYSKNRKGSLIPKVLLYVCLLGIIYVGATSYNGGKNVVNELIIQRLLPDEEKGITGNNRNNATVDDLYESMAASGKLFYGLSVFKVSSYFSSDNELMTNSGYKMFLITHGLITAIMLFIIYMLIGPLQILRGRKSYLWGFIIIAIFSFLSLAVPESMVNLIPMALGVGSYKNSLNTIKLQSIVRDTTNNEDRNFNVPLCT